ncbi:acetyl-CoA hydrolase/transferase family protein [Psychrobacter jeotgali]|uniref:acetyl-CoA hydrolase/transferase family protein n=1 Tax=Psychrobacter jeotgali TaxID=179010 RepID=UPI00191815C6|nr:acetyl-CoA hydrolase/transferase family protein [Psychrobacter jeotgali]
MNNNEAAHNKTTNNKTIGKTLSKTLSRKSISVTEALKLVKNDQHIVTGLGAGEAKLFMESLHTIADDVVNVTVTNCLSPYHPTFYDKKYKKSFNIDSLFFSPSMRKAHKHGNAEFVPNHLHLAGTDRLKHITPDIYVGVATPPDKHGFMSLSLSNTYEKQMIAKAKLVILEVNANYPRTFGDVEVHIDDIDYMIEVDYDAPVLADIEPNDKDLKIGELIAEQIQDGDTIQLGIGGIPNAVAVCLRDKKDLGVHTEMLTSGMLDLIEQGVISGKKKSLHPEKVVFSFALGSKKLYDYLDDNPSILVLNGAYVIDPYVISQNDNMVSINTAIEVDLTGQVCSESIGQVQFSGSGGQTDTAVGAQMAKNGRSIIALYSTAMVKNDQGERVETSKIVTTLKRGAIVTLSRNSIDMIATEYGMVSLKGTNVKERIERLISIAHPKFREALRQEAIDFGILVE